MAPLPPPPPSLLLARAPAEGAAAATPAPLAPASIALIIVGCLALIAACIGGAICYRRWYQRRRRSQQHQHQQLPLAAPNEKAVTPIGAQKAPFSSSSLAAALKHLEYDEPAASGAAFMPPLPISRTLGPLASAFSNASLNQYMPRQQQQQDDEEAQKQRPPLPRQSIRYDPHTSFATNCLRGLTQALDLPLELHDPSTTAPTAPPLPLPAAAVAPPALSSSSSTSASASAFLTAGESTPAALSSMHSESSLGAGSGSGSERRPSTTTMMSSGGETAATSIMAHEEEPLPPTGKHAIATALQSQSDQPGKARQPEATTATPAASSTPFMSGYHHAIFPEPQTDADPQDESLSGDGSGDLSTLSISHSHSHSHSGSISLSVRTRRQRRRERTQNRGPSYVRARDLHGSSVSSRSPAHHPFTMSSPWLAAGDSTSFIQEQWRINTADESDSATRAIEAGMAFLPSLDGPGPLVEAGGSPEGGTGAAEFALVSAEGEGMGVGMERRPSGLGITTLDAEEGDDDAISDDGSQPSDDDDDDDDDASQSRDVPQRRTRRSRRQRTTTSPGSIMQNAKWASSSTPKLPTGTPRDYFTAKEQQQRHLEAEQRSFLPTVSPLSPAEPWSPPSFLAVQPTGGRGAAATSRPASSCTASDLQSPLQRLLLGSPWDEHLARFPGPPPLAVTEAAAVKTLEERRGEVGRWRREVLPVIEGEEMGKEGVERQATSMPNSPSFRLRPLSLCAVSSLGLPPALATATATAPATAAAMGSGVPYTVTTIRKNGSGDTPTLASSTMASSAAMATAAATANAKKAKRGSFLYHISSPPQHLMQQHQQHQRGVGVAV